MIEELQIFNLFCTNQDYEKLKSKFMICISINVIILFVKHI